MEHNNQSINTLVNPESIEQEAIQENQPSQLQSKPQLQTQQNNIASEDNIYNNTNSDENNEALLQTSKSVTTSNKNIVLIFGAIFFIVSTLITLYFLFINGQLKIF